MDSNDMSVAEALPKALFIWLKTLFYFIVLPYKIWKSSVLRLGKTSEEAIISENEEFPVYTFNKVADGCNYHYFAHSWNYYRSFELDKFILCRLWVVCWFCRN